MKTKIAVEMFTKQKHRQMTIQQQYRERIQSETREVAKLGQHLDERVEQCLFCQ